MKKILLTLLGLVVSMNAFAAEKTTRYTNPEQVAQFAGSAEISLRDHAPIICRSIHNNSTLSYASRWETFNSAVEVKKTMLDNGNMTLAIETKEKFTEKHSMIVTYNSEFKIIALEYINWKSIKLQKGTPANPKVVIDYSAVDSFNCDLGK